MLEIKMVQNDDITRACETLQMWYNGELIGEWSDGGEPEDQLFCRDWNWVAGALEKAYELGKKEAFKEVGILRNIKRKDGLKRV